MILITYKKYVADLKLITVNIPKEYLEKIDQLVGNLYPSRCELVRTAIRQALIRDIKKEDTIALQWDDFDDENIVRVPVKSEKEEPVREFKTYKIVRRLE